MVLNYKSVQLSKIGGTHEKFHSPKYLSNKLIILKSSEKVCTKVRYLGTSFISTVIVKVVLIRMKFLIITTSGVVWY